MGSYSATKRVGNKSEDGNARSSLSSGIDKLKEKGTSAAMQGAGIPKPLADLAAKRVQNVNPSKMLPGLGKKNASKPNQSSKSKESTDAKSKDSKKKSLNPKENLKNAAKEKIKEKLLGKEKDSSQANDSEIEAQVRVKQTIAVVGISAATILVVIPFLLIMLVSMSIQLAYGTYNAEDNLYKLNPETTNDSTTSNALFKSLDNFLFIGDSRYNGAQTQLEALGNSITVLGVDSSNPGHWLDATKNGSGTVLSETVTLPDSAPGISIMLGVNDTSQVDNMKTVIQNLHKKYPSAIIFMNSAYHVGSGRSGADSLNNNIDDFNNKMKDYSSENSWLYYIDITSGLHDEKGYLKSELTGDNLHMTSEGNKILADNIKKAVLSINSGISDEDFIFYYQSDSKWGTKPFCGKSSIAGAGCGGTSYAIVVANMTNNKEFDPWDASQEGKGSGYCGRSDNSAGATMGYFTTTLPNKHPELSVKELATTKSGATEAYQVLQSGGMIIANVQKKSGLTSGGHWLVLRGLDSNGKVKIANPNHKGEDKTYDINDFIDKNWMVDSNGVQHSWAAVTKAS